MEKLKKLLGDEGYQKCFSHYKPEDYCEHGLGSMLKTDRQYLLDIGAIVEKDGTDMIACDAWCVNVWSKDDSQCVFEGNKFACEQEAERIKQIKPTIRVEVKGYPKKYVEWYKNESAKNEAHWQEDEATEQLIESGFV